MWLAIVWLAALAYEHSYLVERIAVRLANPHAKVFTYNYAGYLVVSGCLHSPSMQLAFHVYSMCVWYHSQEYTYRVFARQTLGMGINYALGSRHPLLQMAVQTLFTYTYTPMFMRVVHPRHRQMIHYARYVSCSLTALYSMLYVTSIALRIIVPIALVTMFAL